MEESSSSKVPRERLNQIAAKRLAALGIPVRLVPDRQVLTGELALGPQVINPFTRQPLGNVRFEVIGHDRLRFLNSALAALEPVAFYDAPGVAELEQGVVRALQQRLKLLEGLGRPLAALGLKIKVDPERLLIRTEVHTIATRFELQGGPSGVRVSQVIPRSGKPFAVAESYPPLELGEFKQLIDLELFLEQALTQLTESAQKAPQPATPARPRSRALPQSLAAVPGSLPLSLLARFGAEASVAPNVALELVHPFEVDGTRYQFIAVRESGSRFRAKIVGPSGERWSDRFDLEHFPGIPSVIDSVFSLARPATTSVLVAAAPSEGATSASPLGHLQPMVGEVWVMQVLVEKEDENEVRYSGTDAHGQPYGATRILKRADFQSVFVQERGGWRMLIGIESVDVEGVTYRRLNAQRQPVGEPKRLANATLISSFIPEAAAY